jgi:protein transport protein SEC61 subunit gamma-like protein
MIIVEQFTDTSTEYTQLCKAIAIGFVIMGFIGYFVKLIHIPM